MMDILPKKISQFQDTEYWKKFYSDTTAAQSFEWYASFRELEYLLR